MGANTTLSWLCRDPHSVLNACQYKAITGNTRRDFLAGCVLEHGLGRGRSIGRRDGKTRRPDSVAGLVWRIRYVEASRGAHDVCEFDARAITETDAAIAEVSGLDLAYH